MRWRALKELQTGVGVGGRWEAGVVGRGVGIISRLKISPQIYAPSKMNWRVNALVYPQVPAVHDLLAFYTFKMFIFLTLSLIHHSFWNSPSHKDIL